MSLPSFWGVFASGCLERISVASWIEHSEIFRGEMKVLQNEPEPCKLECAYYLRKLELQVKTLGHIVAIIRILNITI